MPDVKDRVAEILSSIQWPSEDELHSDKRAAIRALAEDSASDPIAASVLAGQLIGQPPVIRRDAALALGRMKVFPDSVRDHLVTALADPHERVRAAATMTLGKFTPTPDVAAALMRLLNDDSRRVKAAAVIALGELHAMVAIPSLRELLSKGALSGMEHTIETAIARILR